MMRPDASGLRRLTAAGVFAGSPTWSGNGTHVAFYEMTVDQASDARMGGRVLLGFNPMVSCSS